MVIGSRGSGSGVVWTSVSSEESKNRIMRAPPSGVETHFVIPGIGNPNSALLVRAESEGANLFGCALYSEDDMSSKAIFSGLAYYFNLDSYSNDQYSLSIVAPDGASGINTIEYTFVEFFSN